MQFIIPAKSLLISVPKIEAHIHTLFSDGANSVIEVVEQSVILGLTQIVFTEHTENYFHENDSLWYLRYFDEIEKMRDRWCDRIEIYAGLEVPVADYKGNLDLSDKILKRAEFILGTVHRYPELEKNIKVQGSDPDYLNELEYKALLGLAGNKSIDSIAHMGGTCGKYGTKLSKNQIRTIVRKAKKNNIAVEINSRYHSPLEEYLAICIQENALVTIGSDSHCLETIGECKRVVEQRIFKKYGVKHTNK